MATAMHTTGPRGRGTFWRAYVGAWVTLAAVAATYLGLSVARPELVASAFHQVLPGARVTVQQKLPAADATVGEAVSHLRGEVEELKADIAEVRSTVAGHGPAIERMAASIEALRQSQSASERVAQAEPVPTPVAALPPPVEPPAAKPAREARLAPGSIPPLPTRAPPAPRAAAAPALTVADEKTANRLAALPGKPRVLNEPQPAGTAANPGVTTGSLPRPELRRGRDESAAPATPAPPVIRFGAPVVTTAAPPPASTPPASGATALRLSSGASLASLRISWQVLRQLHAPELGDLEGRYRVQGANYQLLAGPFADRRQADHVCSQLRAKNVSCSIDEFGGNAL